MSASATNTPGGTPPPPSSVTPDANSVTGAAVAADTGVGDSDDAAASRSFA